MDIEIGLMGHRKGFSGMRDSITNDALFEVDIKAGNLMWYDVINADGEMVDKYDHDDDEATAFEALHILQ